MKRTRPVLVGLVGVLLIAADPAWGAAPAANGVLQWLGTQRGLVVVLGDPSCRLAIDLARRSELLVYVQLASSDSLEKARRRAEAAGLDAARIQIDAGTWDRLHLADNLVDGAIVLGELDNGVRREIMRVLRPGGRARIGTDELKKPFPEGMDDWSHPYHGPDNNPLSRDRVIRAPYLTQFLANPRYGPAPQVAVAAAGRVFKAFGHVAWHPREEPWLNTLAAFNAFNGTLLWRRPLPEGFMVHRNTIIATPKRLYFGDHQSCKIFDAATGRLVDQIVPPRDVAGGTFWKWMALEDGVLYALVGEAEPMDQTMRWKREAHGWPWNAVSPGYNRPKNPWGFGRNLMAIDPESKRILWHYHEDQPMDGRAVCMKDGRLFAFRFGAYLVCLDARTGEVKWRRTPDNAPELFEALGQPLERQGWQTNWRTAAYLRCGDGALYFAGPQLTRMVVVSAEDGRLLWQHPYDNFQLVIYPDAAYAISGPWGKNVSRKFDPLTGKVLAELPTGRRACTRPVGTCDSILFRAMGGSVRFDLAALQPRWVSPMRPSCHDGVTVASGLLFWWPFACDCQLTLTGLISLGPAGQFDFTPDWKDPERLRAGQRAEPTEARPASPADWPTFRANNQRTATTAAVVPETVEVLWRARPAALDGVRPTAPIAVGGQVWLAGSDGVVRSLEAKTGRPLWARYTGGEIRLPPTFWQGRVLAGSGDGWVWCLDAATGETLWQFRAAPAERKTPVFGRLLSTWPAASGVLVQDNTAYVAAGLANYDGTYVYALDAASGQVRWCNDTSGHLDPTARTGVSVQGHLLWYQDKLYLAGGNAVSPAVYDSHTGRCLNDPTPLARCESTSPRGWELFLVGHRVIACGKPFYAHPELPVYDHTVTKKMFHTSSGPYDVVWLDSARLACYPPLDRDALSRCATDEKIPRHITQAWGQFRTDEKPHWQRDCPGSVAMAVSRNAVVIADASQVTALELPTGHQLWRSELPAPPVPWGMAIDRAGRVILTLTNGTVLCFGQR